MGLITRFYGPNAKGSKLTIKEMDNNLYYLQSFGVSGITYQNNVLSLINPTGGTNSITINDFYTTGATYNNGIIYFDRNDQLSAYTVNISSLTGGTNTPLTVGSTQISNGGNGRILFQSGTTLQQNNSLFWDNTNKRLGIGVTSPPQYTLDVVNTNSRLFYNSTSAGGLFIVSGTTNIPRFGMLIPSYLTKPSASATMGLRAWDDTIYSSYGKVGDMFIRSSAESNGLNLISAAGSGTEDYIRFYAGINATSTPDIHIQGSGITRGYVGIGTAAPNAKLDVNGKTKTTNFQMTSGAANGYVLTSDVSGNAFWQLPNSFTGGTVNGPTNFTNGLTANTISATTYQNLPLDVFVTGGTYSDGSITLENNTGGTFNITGITKSLSNEWLIASGNTVEIESFTQKFIYGDLYVLGTLLLNQNSQLIVLNGNIINSGGTISGSGQMVLVDLPTFGDLITSGTYSGGTLTLSTSNGSDVTVNGFFTGTTQTITGNYLPLSGGTVSGSTNFTNGLTANTISATTYQNLPLDVTVTGGTFSANTITFTNTTGGTFNVTGVTTTPSVNYTVYKALVSLSGGIFTVTQLENTIGDGSGVSPNDIQWSNPSNGVIRATKTTSFTSTNILISVENINGGGVPYICTGQKSTSNFISIQIFLHDGTLSSTPNFTNLPVEIRIY